MKMHCLNRWLLYSLVIFISAISFSAGADELVSLDDPTPTASAAPVKVGEPTPAAMPSTVTTAAPPKTASPTAALDSLDGTAASGGVEVALDLGAGETESAPSPYLFSRNPLWMLLPLGALILLGLHLLPIPKRTTVRKIDQAQRFFRGGMGEATSTSILIAPLKVPPAEEEKTRIALSTDVSRFVRHGEDD
ncbi:MAG: hypothetical protein H7301_04270 [Cryobacterium sp.]|nr:hypothetical protein [Oligoflexia bacterium]